MKANHLTKETILDIGTEPRDFPEFNVGDKIEVSQLIQEGAKERIQKFTGDVLAFHKNGIGTTFTIRKIGDNNIGVEKILPYYSPNITEIKVIRRGLVRRAKLFYLRDAVGKAAKIKEKIISKADKLAAKQAATAKKAAAVQAVEPVEPVVAEELPKKEDA
jgi:large subunit ribosomal protein L19